MLTFKNVGEKKKQSPPNPMIVAITRCLETFSFKASMDKIRTKNGIVQKMTVTSERGKIVTEYIHPRNDKNPNIPRKRFSFMSKFPLSFLEIVAFLNKTIGRIDNAEKRNLKNKISIGGICAPNNFVTASKNGPIARKRSEKNTPCAYPFLLNQFINVKINVVRF